jgi:hypothetical protein
MGTLLRAILEGFGWRVGTEAAKDALDRAAKALSPDTAPVPPDPETLESERKARAKAAKLASKERAAAEKREEKAIDAELRALKKRIGR